jgi:1-acyl-sn-glycerol-3-phosphate acyltransferase
MPREPEREYNYPSDDHDIVEHDIPLPALPGNGNDSDDDDNEDAGDENEEDVNGNGAQVGNDKIVYNIPLPNIEDMPVNVRGRYESSDDGDDVAAVSEKDTAVHFCVNLEGDGSWIDMFIASAVTTWLPHFSIYLFVGLFVYRPAYWPYWAVLYIITHFQLQWPDTVRKWMNVRVLNGLASLYPLTVVSEQTDLSADTQRIFAVHPHGLVFNSVVLTNALAHYENSPLFCDHPVYIIAAEVVRWFPFLPTIFSSMGRFALASRATLLDLLAKKHSCIVMPGGVDEAVYGSSLEERISATGHYGLAYVAIAANVPVIPAYVFGDLLLVDSYPRCLHRFICWLRRHGIAPFGSPIMPLGRYGVLPVPRNVPVKIVFGEPFYPRPGADATSAECRREWAEDLETRVTKLYEQHRVGSSCEDRPLVLDNYKRKTA